MNILCFKSWLEDMNNQTPQDLSKDPVLAGANQAAQNAVKDAINKKQDPIQAAKAAVLKAKVPMNKLGSIMPKDPTDKSVVV